MTLTEDIKAKIDIATLIQETVQLHESAGEWCGYTGAKSDSGESLKANRSKGTYLNRATGDGGDIFNWLAYLHKLDIKTDFARILHIAADKAGIEMPGKAIDIESEWEYLMVTDALKCAAKHFHDNLTTDMRKDIKDTWGISNDTIDDLLIGIAKNDESLKQHLRDNGFLPEDMLKTGLFLDWDNFLQPFFMGRYVFPYWKNGDIRYMIGRQTKYTPKNKYEMAKYKKLLTHNDKHTFISKHVANDVLYGEDSLIGEKEYCLITEGVTDCIMAIQAGFACVSPVTTTFKNADHTRIAAMVKRFNTVYICNDAEVSGAGDKGAQSTGVYLDSVGINTRLVTLPMVGEKTDLSNYLRDHTKEDFEMLMTVAKKVKAEIVPDRFISEKGAFLHHDFAQHIVRDAPLYCIVMRDNEELMTYTNGVYVTGGEREIRTYIECVMVDHKITANMRTEVIGHLKATAALQIDRSEIDNDPYILNVGNGIFDIRTMKLMPHTPKNISSVQVPIDYVPGAQCTKFEKFISTSLPEPDLNTTVGEMFGHCLIKNYEIQKWFIMVGEGDNGKSVLLKILTAMLGQGNVSAVPVQQFTKNTFASAQLYGKMANIVADISDEEMGNTNLLKALTGDDRINAQKKNQQPFDYENHAKLIYSCNIPPEVKDDGRSFWRRVIPIHWKVVIPDSDKDTRLAAKIIKDEMPGVLNYAIDGLKRLLINDSFTCLPDMADIRRFYHKHSDTPQVYIDECLDVTHNDSDQITVKALYDAYKVYCSFDGLGVKSIVRFGKSLRDITGIEAAETRNGAKVWSGVLLR